MTFRQSLQLMRRWRSVIVAGAVIGVALGWVSAPGGTRRTPAFQATNTSFFDPQARGGSQIQAALLATMGPVPARVAARLGVDRRLVQEKVVAEFRSSGTVLLITGRSTNSAQAEAFANTTAEELIVELGGAAGPLRPLERAVASPVETDDITGPSSRPHRALLLGAFGLALGAGAALTVERLDTRIRSKSTAEDALGLPVMAEVPPLQREDRDQLLSGPPPFIEAYRRLRTGVDRWTPAADNGAGGRVIVVTSPTAGDGKTVTVAHLAAALAEVGRSVVVISADLRRPRLHVYFDRPREPGLTDVLRGAPDTRSLTDLNLATGLKGVSFVASGAPVDNPSPLLTGIGRHLDAARALGEFVLVDAPSLLAASEGADLARHADGVLLVIRAGRTSIGAAARSAEMLQRLDIPVLGAVLVSTGPYHPRPAAGLRRLFPRR